MDPMLSSLDKQFVAIDARSRELLALLTPETLFLRPRELSNSMAPFSCGEFILRSAAMVEKTFGGITTRLWDDPFEWTLPEKLGDHAAILEYLDEVENTRKKGFAFIGSDDDLTKQMPAPVTLTPIIDTLLDTLARAQHFQGRAFALYQVLTGEKPPRS